MMKYTKWLAVAFAVSFLACGCNEDDFTNNIPYQKVDFRFFISENPDLQAFGGIKKFDGNGYNHNGVFVCNVNADATADYAFFAFDATCPKEADFKTAVVIDSKSLLKLKCPKCGTVYDVRDWGRGGGTVLTRYGVKTLSFGYQFQVLN